MLFDFGLGTNYGFRNHKWSKGVVSMIANGITIDYHVFSTKLDNSWSSISGKVASRKRFSIFYTTGYRIFIPDLIEIKTQINMKDHLFITTTNVINIYRH